MFERRVRYLALGGTVYFLLLVARLFSMQVVEAEHWKVEAEKLGRRGVTLTSHRGRIFDVNGRLLAGDRLQYDLELRLDQVDDLPWRCARCARHVHLSPKIAPRKCRECGGVRFEPGTPVDRGPMLALLGLEPDGFADLRAKAESACRDSVDAEIRRRERRYGQAKRSDVENVLRIRNWPIFEDAPAQAVKEVALHPDRNWGVVVDPVWRRARHEDEVMSWIVGTVRGVRKEDGDALVEKGYTWPEIYSMSVGRNGVESKLNDRLLNRDGLKIVERDRMGGVVRVISEEQPVDGEDIRLTLDLDVQKRMTGVLAEACREQGASAGAFVAMDPATGEILALVSYMEDPDATDARGRPIHIFDPTLSNVVPGSVFKVVTAIGALESESETPDTLFTCQGPWHGIRCSHDHGEVAMVEAISGSCNKYFAEVAGKMGIELFAWWARRLGFDEQTGIELPGEAAGLIPDPAWKQEQYALSPEYWGQPGWVPSDTWQVGFGRGALLVTPVQVARFMGIIAAGGRFVRPSIVLGEGGLGERVVSPGTLEVVRRGMEATVTRGTAARTDLGRYRAAGKTGTAEIEAGFSNHMSWFAGYAPAERPQVAFACVIKETADTGAEGPAQVVSAYLEGAGIR